MKRTPGERTAGAAIGPARALGVLSLLAMTAVQVASGLDVRPERYVTAIVALLAASAVAFAADAWGPRRAVGAFCAAVLTGYAAELAGVLTGFPFGSYSYTGVLWPQAGGVPVVVTLAWGGMGLAAYAVGAALATGWGRVFAGACALTAWDLFLDPQMVGLGLWRWADDGFYRGIPLSNFAGWLLVSALVMLVIGRAAREPGPASGLLVLYTVMAVMETVAFAAVFVPPDPLVAAAGGLAMGGFAVASWRRACGRAQGRAQRWAQKRAQGRTQRRARRRAWQR